MKHFGKVKSYNREKSFGFITELKEHGIEEFFHIDNVVGHITLCVGDLVSFDIGPSRNKPGKTQAINVQLAKMDEIPSSTEGVL